MWLWWRGLPLIFVCFHHARCRCFIGFAGINKRNIVEGVSFPYNKLISEHGFCILFHISFVSWGEQCYLSFSDCIFIFALIIINLLWLILSVSEITMALSLSSEVAYFIEYRPFPTVPVLPAFVTHTVIRLPSDQPPWFHY
jgi:hypothetical protein